MTDDQATYSSRWIRFVRLPYHAEAYEAAYLDQSASARNELQRLRREYETLPPRHAGWCEGECPAEVAAMKRGAHPSPCLECARLRANVQYRDIGVEIGRNSPVEAPMPSVIALDLARAMMVLGERASAHEVSVFLSEGAA